MDERRRNDARWFEDRASVLDIEPDLRLHDARIQLEQMQALQGNFQQMQQQMQGLMQKRQKLLRPGPIQEPLLGYEPNGTDDLRRQLEAEQERVRRLQSELLNSRIENASGNFRNRDQVKLRIYNFDATKSSPHT